MISRPAPAMKPALFLVGASDGTEGTRVGLAFAEAFVTSDVTAIPAACREAGVREFDRPTAAQRHPAIKAGAQRGRLR